MGGWRRQEHARQERAFPGMNTAERVMVRVSLGGGCPALSLRPDVEHNALHCVREKWNGRCVNLLSHSSPPFPSLQVEEETLRNEGIISFKPKQTPGIPFTVLLIVLLLPAKKKYEELQSLLEQKNIVLNSSA